MNLKPFVLSLFLASAFVACDTDFLELNSDVFDGQNFEFFSTTFPVSSDQVSLNPIQSDNLSVAPFGILYNNGLQKVEAHYVSQLLLPSPRITFPLTEATPDVPAVPILPTVEKVVLYVPYFSRQTGIENEIPLYALDSVYVDDSKIKMSVYENKYLLRDFNPGSTTGQDYFSDKYESVNSVSAFNRLNNVTTNDNEQNDLFSFKNKQIKYVLPKVDPTDPAEEEKEEKLAPGLFAELDIARFQEVLVEYEKEQRHVASSRVFNQNIFNTWFRGIFLKVEENTPDKKHLALLNYANAFVKVYYRETTANGTKSIKNFDLRFGGRSISLYNNTNPINTDGSKIFLQGTHGQMAKIKLFTDEQLNQFRADYKVNHLINEAELTFHVADETISAKYTPYRIYLYDFKNNRTIADFFDDSPQNTPARDRYRSYGGFYDKNTKTYKIRVTEHIKRLLAFEATDTGNQDARDANVELGLVIIQNITDFGFRNIKDNTDNKIPRSIAYQPLSTVLYSESGPEDKRLKLKITYTKPKN